MPDSEPLILTAAEAGNPQFPRYVVVDQHSRVWTGKRFTQHAKSVRLFSSLNDACFEIQEILRRSYESKKCWRYTAPVAIEVFSDEPVPHHELIHWLAEAAALWMGVQ